MRLLILLSGRGVVQADAAGEVAEGVDDAVGDLVAVAEVGGERRSSRAGPPR